MCPIAGRKPLKAMQSLPMLGPSLPSNRPWTLRNEKGPTADSAFTCRYSKDYSSSRGGGTSSKRWEQKEDRPSWKSNSNSSSGRDGESRDGDRRSGGGGSSSSNRFDRAPARSPASGGSSEWRSQSSAGRGRYGSAAGRAVTERAPPSRKDAAVPGEWGLSRPQPPRRQQDDDEDDAEWDGEQRAQDDDGDEDGDEPRGAQRGGRWEGQRRWDGPGQQREGSGQWNADEERAPTIRDELEGEVLYGVFPVLNALKANRRKLHALYVLSSLDLSKRKDASALREVFRLVKELDIALHKVERHDLNLLSADRQHQGLVLDCSPLEWTALDTFPTASDISLASPAAPAPVWLALDEVMDPQNFGAIVRSAHCLGAAGVLACGRNCAPMSATVSKASAGTLEVVEVHSCQNMVKTLSQAVADGWQVLGAVADHRAQECRKMHVDKPTILVVGNEGSGLRTNIKRACSGFVKVEMGLPRMRLAADSLNVSVAASILMHSAIGSALALRPQGTEAEAEAAGEGQNQDLGVEESHAAITEAGGDSLQ